MSRNYRCRQKFGHSSSANTFPLPVPPPPPPPSSSSTSVSGVARCRPCPVCSSAARYSLVLDELQTCDLSTMTSPPTLTGNGTRPQVPDVTPPDFRKTDTAAGTARRGRIVPGRCRGRVSACSLVLLPMVALLSLEALWIANHWQVEILYAIYIRHHFIWSETPRESQPTPHLTL